MTAALDRSNVMLGVFLGCITTGLMPKKGSPCHEKIMEIMDENDRLLEDTDTPEKMSKQKPMSRQLRKQRKLRSEGKCQSCGHPAEESPRGGRRALCLACAARKNPNAKRHHPRSAWREVDWSKSNREIAAEMNVVFETAVKWRKEITGNDRKVDWNAVDWTKTNATLAEELGRSAANIGQWRNRVAPVKLRSTAWKTKNLK